jgi:hypothetical protein
MPGTSVLVVLMAMLPAIDDSLPGWAIPIVLAVVIAVAAAIFFLARRKAE